MIELIGKSVVVLANDIEYKGRLVEINDQEVHLQSPDGWIVIPTDSVSEIRADESSPGLS